MKLKRRLATILATDCVGFSKHMEESEELTLLNLKACREIIDPIIEEYGGRIFHTAGDSVIAEFQSPVECVNGAIEIQKMISERNNFIEKGPKLLWRIGIHLDDVIIEGDNIFGSGVNIAARLEAQCQPGEILVSRIVSEQVSKRVQFAIHSSGTKSLKNISDAFEAFTISPLAKAGSPRAAQVQDKLVEKITIDRAYKQKLAVLPFKDLSKGDETGFLVDGIVEDLITEFSMVREVEIISRQSSFDFRDKALGLSEFIEKFSIDYIVTGSIRASGKRVRISVELSDAETAKVVWSNRFDRVIEDIFDVQDKIVRKILNSLIGEIEISSLNRAKRKPTENITSYEYLLRGKELHHRFTKEANLEAQKVLTKAIEADPKNAQAYAWKACVIGQGVGRGFMTNAEEMYAEAKELIEKAIEISEKDFECHRMLGEVYLSMHKFDLAKRHSQIAFELNPNDPRVLSVYGEALLRAGNPDEGLAHLEKAFELDPIPQGQTNSLRRISAIIFGCFLIEDYQRCISFSEQLENFDFRTWLLLAKIFSLKSSKDLQLWLKKSNFIISGLDLNMEIDRFHLNDDKLKSSLIKFAKELSSLTQ